MRLVPWLDHEVAFHLVRDDDRAFDEFCRGIGLVQTQAALGGIGFGIRCDTPEIYRRTRHTLDPYLFRVADVMDSTWNRPEFARLYSFRASFGDDPAHIRLLVELGNFMLADAGKLPERIEGFLSLGRRLQGFGDERELITIESCLAREVMRDGRFRERMRLLHSALARARRLSESNLVCQLLGELGSGYRFAGDVDSMMACYREGIARADRCGIPDQAARLRLFLANHYFGVGRYAAGARLLQDAQDACRRLGGSPLEVRAVVETMNHHADLQCWDLVHRSAARLPVLVRMLERTNNLPEMRRYSMEGRRLNVRWLVAMGHAGEAADSMEAIVRLVRPTGQRESVGRVLLQYADVLLEAGRAQDALTAAAEGIANADSNHLIEVQSDLQLVRARAALAIGLLDEADRALADGIRPPAERPGTTQAAWLSDGIAARIALARGDTRQAERMVRRGLESLRDSVRKLDRDPHSDLTILAAEDLSVAIHTLLAHAPREQLAFEQYWRSLPSWAGGEPDGIGTHVARDAPPQAERGPVAQLVYALRPEGIVRWTVLPWGVRGDTLTVSPDECLARVGRVSELTTSDPEDVDAPMPKEILELARQLGRDLLPAEIRSQRFASIIVSAEGPLGRLPFELLDASTDGGYVPLLSRSDVRYARYVHPRVHRAGTDMSVILADAGSMDTRNGRQLPLQPLPAIEKEIEEARRILPNARVVRGTQVTKQSLLNEWASASAVYVAAHLVRDTDAPLFNYFPILFGEGEGLSEEHFLDIRDVRDTNLSRCRLVVLSSCAGGEPYVAGMHSGPSMADAFLDAGAQAVIHTRWRVRDESAAETAPRLARAWLGRGSRAEAAWHEARMKMMLGPRGIRHPFEWAAWSMTTAVPVPVWIAPERPLSSGRVIATASPRARPTGSLAPAE